MPSVEEMRQAGFEPEDYAHEVVELWPENWPAFRLFDSIGTQWRVGVNGPTGLDYGVLFHKMDRLNLTPDEYEQFEDDIRVLEQAALSAMRKKT